jgi:nitrate reductase gamma subunit
MESTRTKPFFYLQFVAFHLGVTAAIGLLFIIPLAPGLLENGVVVLAFRIPIGAAFLVGLLRVVRRFRDPYIRAISSPDDFFAVMLLTVWFFFAFLAVPNSTANGEWHLLGYFFLATFFLVYVPFSKISHYLYYPFTRYYLGKSLGHRGVFPILRGPVHG